jgi:hypothetical protein
MRTLILCGLLGAASLPAREAAAEDPPAAPAEDAGDAAAAPQPQAAAAPADAAKPEAAPFVPPDGWRPKKRGKYTVYCRKQVPMGTRVPAEVCHDEIGIRAMLAAQTDDRERADQLRRICGSQAACGGGN